MTFLELVQFIRWWYTFEDATDLGKLSTDELRKAYNRWRGARADELFQRDRPARYR